VVRAHLATVAAHEAGRERVHLADSSLRRALGLLRLPPLDRTITVARFLDRACAKQEAPAPLPGRRGFAFR
jgi:hypothetical protein